jgi:hypothetical protein
MLDADYAFAATLTVHTQPSEALTLDEALVTLTNYPRIAPFLALMPEDRRLRCELIMRRRLESLLLAR